LGCKNLVDLIAPSDHTVPFMTQTTGPIRVTALYRFARFSDCTALAGPLEAVCRGAKIKGTLLLAPEGINGTIAGTHEAIEQVLAHIRTLPGCAALSVKDAQAQAMPFYRMKVKIKREIVTMGQPDIDPLSDVGTYIAPKDWNALISEPGTIVIDTRNDYEVGIGTFAGAINPNTQSFRDFPDWFRSQRQDLLANQPKPKIAMFCTGGIRCEKATAFLKAEGLDAVYHLDGGILKYLETVPEADSLWQGECFVFDQRVAVTHGLAQGTHSQCFACRMPLSPEDMASPHYIVGESCPHCFETRDEASRARYAERQRQETLAAERGVAHLGANDRIKP
jgi:UPF0176 protein